MRGISRIALLLWAAAELPAAAASAQILRELDPIHLGYDVYFEDATEPVGHVTASFVPQDTERGRRLVVEWKAEYTVPRATPFHYAADVTLTCDEKGVQRFVATETAGDNVKTFTGVRIGIDYQVVSDVNGVRSQKTITAGVQRTDVGLFCAGFLERPIRDSEFFEDYPMLFPVMANHEGRHRFYEGTIVTQWNGEPVSVFRTHLRHPSKTSDFYWHSTDEHEKLLYLTAQTGLGELRFELVSVNGEPTSLGSLFR